MTDLVQKLVGALEETLLFCETFSNRWDGQTGAHPFGMVERARAALSEAKAGGWVAVPESTTGDAFENAIRRYGVVAACEWFGYAHDSEFTKETQRVLNERLQPLPAPPAQRGEG